MALDLSRGLVPNFYLWFGNHTPPFEIDTTTTTYPDIRPINTKPPCTPELVGEICDPRCAPDTAGCGSTLPLPDCQTLFVLGGQSEITDANTRLVCAIYEKLKRFVIRIRQAEIDQNVTDLLTLPTEEEINAYSPEQAYLKYQELLTSPKVQALGIRPQITGTDPCKIILENITYINEC